MDAKSVEEFQEQIGIKFHEPSRLWNAFIHSSYANERRMSKDKNNERLEFLGDAVLRAGNKQLSVSALIPERIRRKVKQDQGESCM